MLLPALAYIMGWNQRTKVIFYKLKSHLQVDKSSDLLHTCKECEDEVNRKGHITKLQEAVHVDNVKYIKSEWNIILSILKHV